MKLPERRECSEVEVVVGENRGIAREGGEDAMHNYD